MKWLLSIAEALKDSPTLKKWGGVSVAVLILVVGMGWTVERFGDSARKMLSPGVTLDPARLGQLLEAERHSGHVPVKIVGHGDNVTSFYESGCQYSLMRWQGLEKGTWVQHPSEIPPPPEHDHSYGDLSAAGLSAPRCSPPEACWYPVWDHPYFDDAEVIGQRPLDQCWVEQLRQISDGCQYVIRVYLCGGGIWEDRENAQWNCCRRHG